MMTIGEKISLLRMERGITQQRLAAVLQISPQAISKWENGSGNPNLSQIVPLADFFGISTDELLGYGAAHEQARVEELRMQSEMLVEEGCFAEDYALWRQACDRYAKNYVCTEHLMLAAYQLALDSGWQDRARLEESIRLGRQILSECTRDDIRAAASQTLVQIYSTPGCPSCSIELAAAIADHACPASASREALRLRIIENSATAG